MGSAVVPALLDESPVTLPRRIAELAAAASGSRVAVYVIDIDGSRLTRLAGDKEHFPEMIRAPIGVGPEVALEHLPALERICTSRIPGSATVGLVVRDRAIGALVCERPSRTDLTTLARQAGAALELTSGYTDIVHSARRRKEIQPAAEIQTNLLPPRLAQLEAADLAGAILPGYDVAGDFFDYAANADGLWLCVADAMGKGNEAAALASLAVGALRAARRGGATLEQSASLIDATVAVSGPNVRFLTAILAHWHAGTSTFRWIDAGHPPPMLIHADGSTEELSGARTYPLGLREEERTFRVNARRLEHGERILLYTDGVTERRSPDGTLLGIDGLGELLAAGPSVPVAALLRRVQDAVIGASPKPLRDDVTMLLLAPLDRDENAAR